MSYDSAIGGIVLFGGETYYNVARSYTWEFANNTWVNLTSSFTIAPSPRVFQAQAYDGAIQSLVIFGGIAGPTWTGFNDTWELGSNGWTNVTSSAGAVPIARVGGTMAYDPAAKELVMFGGQGTNQNCPTSSVYHHTWLFRQGKWDRLNVSGPTGRDIQGMTWDPSTSSIIMWGGSGSRANFHPNSTSSFSNRTWVTLNATGPGGTGVPVLAFDERAGGILLYAVYYSTALGYYDQTWMLS